MSERLEIIKFLRNSEKTVAPGMQPSELISRKDVDWLIQQAERVEALEEENDELAERVHKLALDWSELVDERNRYKQALEEIARGRFSGASYKARQALEGDDD